MLRWQKLRPCLAFRRLRCFPGSLHKCGVFLHAHTERNMPRAKTVIRNRLYSEMNADWSAGCAGGCARCAEKQKLALDRNGLPYYNKRCCRFVGAWCNGNTWVSKTFVEGSSPSAPAERQNQRPIGCWFFFFRDLGTPKPICSVHSMAKVCILLFF